MGKKDKIYKERAKGVSKMGANCRILGSIDKYNRQLVEMGHDIVLGGESEIVLHGPIRPYRTNTKVIIEDYVWIGRRCLILPGVCIGRASIIGAMSLVCNDIDSYVIAAGNPCKKIRKLKPLELLRTRAIKKDKKLLGLLGTNHWTWDSLTMDDIKDLFGYGSDCCYDNKINLDSMSRVSEVLE